MPDVEIVPLVYKARSDGKRSIARAALANCTRSTFNIDSLASEVVNVNNIERRFSLVVNVNNIE